MVTGRLPYEAETPLAVILKHLNDPLPSPRDFNPELLPEVELIITTAMDKDPEARYQSAEQMVQQINAAAGLKLYDTGPILVTPPKVAKSPGAGQVSGGGSGGSKGGGHDDTAAGRGAQGPESPNLATSTAVRPPANRSLAGLGAIAVVGLLGWFLLTTLATGKMPFLAIVVRPTETPTVTATPTHTPTVQSTSTPTATPTNTPTIAPTDTAQPTS